MLIHTRDNTTVGQNEKLEQDSFALSRNEKDEEFAMDVMSAQLYSDPLKIICQEYMSNARDAHRAAGCAATPIQVHLPSEAEPWFEVTDKGNGISREDYKNIFLKYFASSKRDSVRENGGFGLGAKSAWSYDGANSEFFVTTVHDGIEYRYHCYRNENKKRVSDFLSQSRIGKDESSGTTIRISINKNDISTFIGKFRDITLLWGVKPKVVYPADFVYSQFSSNTILFENDDVTVFDRNVGARNAATALVDDIPYPIDVNILRDNLTDGEQKFMRGAVYLHCDKLCVDPVPSRENLEYNARTRGYLISKIKSAYAAVNALVMSRINAASNYIEAMAIAQDEYVGKLASIVQDVAFDGVKIPESKTVRYEGTYRRGKDRTSVYFINIKHNVDGTARVSGFCDCSNHNISPATPFVFQYGGNPHKLNDKLNAVIDSFCKSGKTITGINLVRLPSEDSLYLKETVTALERDYNWSKLNAINLADVVVPKVKMERGKNTIKGTAYIVKNDILEKVNVDFKGKYDIYIPIKNKTVTILGVDYRFNDNDVKSFKQFITVGTNLDFNTVKIYAVPVRFMKKLARVKTMRSFDEVVKEAENKLRSQYDFDDVVSRNCHKAELSKIINNLNSGVRDIHKALKKVGRLDENSIIHKACSITCADAQNQSTTDSWILWYLRKIGVDTTKAAPADFHEAKETIEKCGKMYCMLVSSFSTYSLQYDTNDKLNFVADIIDMIERKNTQQTV